MALVLPEPFVVWRGEACSLLAAARDEAVRALGADVADTLDGLVAATLGTHAEARDLHDSASTFEPAVRMFAEQFVTQVSEVTPALIEPAASALFARTATAADIDLLARGFFVLEYTQRLQAIARRLFVEAPLVPISPAPISPAGAQTSLRAQMAAYQDSVVRGDALDAALTEFVRLRCARTHQCEICSTLRLSSARDAGVDASLTDMIDRYETSALPEQVKTFLRLTDAFILHPSLLTDELVVEAHAACSEVQLVEWCLDVTKWSTQKVNVALGTDGAERLPINADGIAYFDFDDDGRVAGYSPV